MDKRDRHKRNVIYGLYCVCEACAPERRIRYVGLTRVSAWRRFRDHLKPYQVEKPYPVNAWKKKHGVGNIRMKILEEVPPEESLEDREIFWIAHFRTFTDDGFGGLNRTRGGYAEKSDYIRAAIKEANSQDGVTWAKINREYATEIRKAYDEGVSTRELAERFGITQGHVWSVVQNQVWKDPDYTPTPRGVVVYKNPENPSWALTRDQAYEIRARYADDPDTTKRGLALEYGISEVAVNHVLQNVTWIDPGYTPVTQKPVGPKRKERISETQSGIPKPPGHGGRVSKAIRGERHGMGKLTEADVIEIRKMVKSGTPQRDVGEMFGIKQSQVSRIVTGARWGHVKEGLG